MSARRMVAALGAVVVAGLLAQATSRAAQPRVIEIDVPEPTRPPPPPPPPPGPDGQPAPGTVLPDGTVVPPAAPSRPFRRGPREVKGEAPTALSGRYEVVQLTIDGETEDYRLKMEREGKALDADCITVRRVFDFGPPGEGQQGLPAEVGLSEQQECYKGGLGAYANELWVLMPATWSQVAPEEGASPGLALELPPVEATATLVRVREPEKEDLNTPPHWLGPQSKLEQEKTRWQIVAEPPASRKETLPAAIHLVGPHVTYHLEPEPPDGPFER
ncbi:MAG: hypothetical protein R3F59_08970 [Myxococcota bacterium]